MKAVTALTLLQGDIMGQMKDRQGASELMVGRKVRCSGAQHGEKRVDFLCLF